MEPVPSHVGSPSQEASRGDYEEFVKFYDPSWVNWSNDETGQTTLLGAMANKSPADRAAIANRLLDDGADPTLGDIEGFTPLHSLLGARNHDLALDIPLLKRLVAGGADLNGLANRVGTPLRALLTNRNLLFPDSKPLLETFLSYPGIDVLAVAANGNSHLETARRMNIPWRTELLEDYLRREGLDVPPPVEIADPRSSPSA